MSALQNLGNCLQRWLVLVSAGGCLMTFPAVASCLDQGLMLEHTQIRATAPNAPVAAGYLQITNKTGQPQTLISASAPFSQKTELHDMKHENGVMKMYEIEGGLALPDGLTVALMPRGRHLMFMGLDRQLKTGEAYEISLTFTPCGTVVLPFTVVKRPAHRGDQSASHSGGHSGGRSHSHSHNH